MAVSRVWVSSEPARVRRCEEVCGGVRRCEEVCRAAKGLLKGVRGC